MSQNVPSSVKATAESVGKIKHLRWYICGLLFFATVINYVDRNVLGILKGTLQKEIGWNEIDYGNIVFWFQAAYALGFLGAGRMMDWLGTRKGFSLSLIFWSVAAMGHALAQSVMGFSVARFALGIGEAGNFPGAIKTVAEWFPKKERALATGIFNSGTNVGATITPLIVPFITIHFGWRGTFIVTGALGFIWLFFWLVLYRQPEQHPRLSTDELKHIQSDPLESSTKISWFSLFPLRQTWAFSMGKFLTDPIWWVYLFWMPDFLSTKHGLDIKSSAVPLILIYLAADFGSVGGGWFSSSLIKRGWSVNKARKTVMLICAISVVPIAFAAIASNLWVAVGLICLATFSHQGWSANLFTTTSDMFPRRVVGSVVGIGSMAGSIGGMLIAQLVGHLLEWTHSYVPIFMIASSAYLIAFGVFHLLSPKLEPARI